MVTSEDAQKICGGQHAGIALLLAYVGDHQYIKSSQLYGSYQDTDGQFTESG